MYILTKGYHNGLELIFVNPQMVLIGLRSGELAGLSKTGINSPAESTLLDPSNGTAAICELK